MQEIEWPYVAGRYTHAEITFDPHDDEGHDWTAEYVDMPYRRPIPQLMYVASLGHTVARQKAFDEGYPPGVRWDL
ncbi:MAG: hypothetical protein ACXWQR_15800 [Ktedonobacterales bacterium]